MPVLRFRASPAKVASVLLAASTACLLAVALGLQALVQWPAGPNAPSIWFSALFSTVIVSFGGVGALLTWRVPHNPLAWLVGVIGLAAAVSLSSGIVTLYDIGYGGVPGAPVILWVGTWAFTPALITAVVFVPLLFPTGSLPSRRWRPFAAFGVFAIVSIALQQAFGPWPASQFPGLPNPYELHGPLATLVDVSATVANVTGPPALLTVLGSIVVRFRRSKAVERQQLKWFAYAGILVVALEAAANLVSGPVSDALFLMSIVTLNLLPVAIGVAILRYRLYEIDRVINRTVVYGSLTVLLAAVYAASVLALETVMSPLTRTGSFAVALSTLVVAALFQPARRRLQTAVNRRFYRARYDASREVAGFGLQLRDQVDAGRLTATLGATLDRTVQPAFASIWLRGGGER